MWKDFSFPAWRFGFQSLRASSLSDSSRLGERCSCVSESLISDFSLHTRHELALRCIAGSASCLNYWPIRVDFPGKQCLSRSASNLISFNSASNRRFEPEVPFGCWLIWLWWSVSFPWRLFVLRASLSEVKALGFFNLSVPVSGSRSNIENVRNQTARIRVSIPWLRWSFW